MSDIEQIPAKPLKKRFRKRGDKTRFATAMGVEVQNVTNWLARGVPARMLPKVAAWCGLTVEQYRQEAGLPEHQGHPRSERSPVTTSDEFLEFAEYWAKLTPQLKESFLALVRGLASIDTGRRGMDGNGNHPMRRATDQRPHNE